MTTAAPNRPRPRCGSTDAVQIIYGLPDFELGEAAQRGEVLLGGCIVGPESPDYECRNCHAPLPWVAPEVDTAHDEGHQLELT
jgi:hypothetical protein